MELQTYGITTLPFYTFLNTYRVWTLKPINRLTISQREIAFEIDWTIGGVVIAMGFLGVSFSDVLIF